MRILGSGKQHWFSPHFYTHLTRLTFQTLNILHGGTAASQGSVPRSKRGDVAGRRWLPPASLIQVQLSTGPRVEAEIAAEDQGRMQPSALHLGPLAKARVEVGGLVGLTLCCPKTAGAMVSHEVG